ncbi:MAG: ferrous iron transport protein B [Desulfobacteraceae bacterium]|jgi:ferrous iron transport protein B
MKEHSGDAQYYNLGLAGQPNTGKSTLFNRLTGARQHVGNWPGKTVERKSGVFSYRDMNFGIVDLPGTYSLSANSAEELISRSHIVSDEMDALIVMVDASQLQRSMYLPAEITGINIPVIVVCTMVDVAEGHGKSIDTQKLEQKLGVPVTAINAVKGEGIDILKERVAGLASKAARISENLLLEKYRSVIGEAFDRIIRLLPKQGINKYSAGWLAIRLIEGDQEIVELVKTACDGNTFTDIEAMLSNIENGPLSAANARYAWIEDILADVVSKDTADPLFKIKGFDRVAIHWFWGKVMAVIMVLLGISASLLVASPVLVTLYYIALPMLSKVINRTLTSLEVPLLIHSFLSDALFPGISFALLTVTFIVSSILLFGVMENIGYVSRIAYVFNSWMERLGLHGKSVLPFISGFLCNIIGVAGSRVIDSSVQRRTTIVTSLVVPCMSCWGVILLVASIFFGINAIWVVMSLLMVTALHITFTAWLFGDRSTSRADAPGLIMELPPYHKPSWRAIFQFVLARTKNVASKTGSMIFTAIFLIWALTYSGTGDITGGIFYKISKAMEPVSMFIGLDWRLLIAFIFSAFAKEASLGVIAILFGIGELDTSLTGTLVSPVLYDAGQLTSVMESAVSKASALAFVFAFYFNVPCFATIAIIRSETHSTRFTMLAAGYYFITALVIAGIAYRIGLIIF